MTNRKLVINNCNDCMYFDNQYYGYEERCARLNVKIIKSEFRVYPIPDVCPLLKTDEPCTKEQEHVAERTQT